MIRFGRSLLFVAMVSLTSGSLLAQQFVVDSLVRVLNNSKNDLQKAKLYHRVVSATWDFDFERAYEFSQQELALANKLKDPEAKTVALTDMGMYHYFVGSYSQAAQYYNQAITAADGKDFGEFPAYTYTRIGNLYRVQGEFDSASYYYEKSIVLLKNKPAGISLASLYFHIGWLNLELSQYNWALQNLYQAKAIRYKIGDSLLIAECWRVIGMTHLGKSDMDSADFYLNKVRGIAQRYGDTELLIQTNINRGDYFQAVGQPIEAVRAYEAALDSLALHDFKRYRALALAQIGIVYDSRSDYLKAIDYYLASLRLNEELNNRHEIARIHGYMGWAHHNLKNFKVAQEQATICIVLMRKANDRAGQAFGYNLMGNIAYQQADFKNAELYYDSALRLRQQLDLDVLVSNTIFNLARVYERTGRYDDALQYYKSDLEVVARLKNQRILALCYNNMGWLYALKRDYKNAEKNLLEGQRLSIKFGQPIDVRENYLNLARLYKLAGRITESNTYYEKYILLNDSLLIQGNALAALQRDALFQLEKKNQEIQNLSIKNKLREQEIRDQNDRIYLQNMALGLGVMALILTSIVALVSYRSYRMKLKANQELSNLNRAIHEQKEEIEAQAEELTEANETIHSINKGLEFSVEERTQQLKQAYIELDTFIYRSSHDLRRPLTTFMGLAEVGRISVKDSTALELFSKVDDTAQNLDRMLAKLQSVSLITSAELTASEIAFEYELDFALSRFRNDIIEKRIRVERSIKLTKSFLSYAGVIRVILDNLIENAIQFSAENPFVRIDVAQQDNMIQIRVEDNGEGVPEEFRNRLFEMYFRASERSKGNGLGLYLVRKAAEKLKGTTHFAPNNIQGSIFTVSISSL